VAIAAATSGHPRQVREEPSASAAMAVYRTSSSSFSRIGGDHDDRFRGWCVDAADRRAAQFARASLPPKATSAWPTLNARHQYIADRRNAPSIAGASDASRHPISWSITAAESGSVREIRDEAACRHGLP